MNDLRDEAVVLRTYRSGEADKIVVLWTREHGKIRAIAKGVRKTTSKIGGAIETLAHVDVFLALGRGLAIVRQVQHRAPRPVLHGDFDRLTAGMSLLEGVDAMPTEGVADEDVFVMLVRALDTLNEPAYDPTLVPAAFFFKLLGHDGSEPVLTECVSCGSLGPLVSFDAAVGGTLCASCRSGRPISAPALDLVRRLVLGDLGAVLREINPEGAGEVTTLAHESLEQHYGRRLKVARSTATLL